MIANYIIPFLGGASDVILVFLSYAICKDYVDNYSFSDRALGKIIGIIVIPFLMSHMACKQGQAFGCLQK